MIGEGLFGEAVELACLGVALDLLIEARAIEYLDIDLSREYRRL